MHRRGGGWCESFGRSVHLKGFVKSYAKVRLSLSTLPLLQNNKITLILNSQCATRSLRVDGALLSLTMYSLPEKNVATTQREKFLVQS